MARRGLCVALLALALWSAGAGLIEETVGITGTAPAWAQSAPGRIIVRAPGGGSSGPAGGPVTIVGAGFGAGDQIEIHWNGSAGEILVTATGPSFQVGATIPPDAAPGTYNVVATGLDQSGQGIGQAVARFTVAPARAPPSGGRQYPGPDPYPPPSLPAFPGCSPLASNVIRGAGTIVGTVFQDRIFASARNDVVRALAGDDCVDLGAGADRGAGGPGADLILGRVGGDRLNGGLDRDRLRGGAGNDRISAGGGNDRASGDRGNDGLVGGSGNDRLTGGSGRDRLGGGPGKDRLAGGPGGDRISARDRERDRISCGRGSDRVAADAIDRVSRSCERVRRRPAS